MSEIVIKVENLGKQYHLGKVGTGTIASDINRWWHLVRGKEDPYLKIGSINDRTVKSVGNDIVWAVKDVNFEVKQGEVLGIIGRNGAGKSTLLKILSRVTAPTVGNIKVKGRIASLLEVGTGFHPDLSGRENIYLNGAILGMTKAEIRRKFDEIVDFSGVERYIDTPVKRYSSGMYVRLAFAVAAHLEPEILIVDEVLAVGDAEFQKKCMGKMRDVSGQGRTVLFVSHNMASMNQLCDNGILLKNGTISAQGQMTEIIPQYLNSGSANSLLGQIQYETSVKPLQIKKIAIVDYNNEIIEGPIPFNKAFYVEVDYEFREEIKKCNLTIVIQNASGETVWFIDRTDYYKDFFIAKIGKYKARVEIPNPLLNPGRYFLTIGLNDNQSKVEDHKHSVLKFEISNTETIRETRPGSIFMPLKWEMIKE